MLIKSNKKKLKRKYTDYLVLFLFIANSGFPFFSSANFFVLFLFFFSLLLFIKRRIKFDSAFFLIICVFLVVEALQVILHGGFTPVTYMGTYIKLCTVYFIVKLLSTNFDKYYVNIIYVFSVISLFFYTLNFIPGITDFIIAEIAPYFESPFKINNDFYDRTPSIIIFNFNALAEYRNSGPFWEPGGFAVYLCLALLFNLISSSKIFKKKNILFFVCILTTISTAGYLALFLILVGFLWFKKGHVNKLVLGVLLTLSILGFSYFDFMQRKIEHNIEIAGKTTGSRFGSALADYNLFVQSPYVGWGRGNKRYGENEKKYFDQEKHRNNGVFGLLATYGIFVTLLYFYLIYKSFFTICEFRNYLSSYSIVAFMVILILGFSQYIFAKPFFYSFLFLYLNFQIKPQKLLDEKVVDSYTNI